MTYIDALIFAIVEGITEFLPISSTGHLVLTSRLLGVPQTEFVKSFEVIIQLGAILAVVVLYWNKLFNFKKGLAINKQSLSMNNRVWINVIAAFIPTAIIGFALYSVIKNILLGNEYITLAALFIGGVLLILLEKIHTEKNTHVSKIEDLSIKQSILIGLAQSISIIPGVSRSAASILGGMFFGAKRQTAVEFSFLLAIPTMMAATGLDLLETNFALTSQQWLLLSIGFIGSFVVALIVVKWFIKFVQKNTFVPFGIYRIIAAFLYWVIVLG
jgi:undecaprenyl-diphosphatase